MFGVRNILEHEYNEYRKCLHRYFVPYRGNVSPEKGSGCPLPTIFHSISRRNKTLAARCRRFVWKRASRNNRGENKGRARNQHEFIHFPLVILFLQTSALRVLRDPSRSRSLTIPLFSLTHSTGAGQGRNAGGGSSRQSPWHRTGFRSVG